MKQLKNLLFVCLGLVAMAMSLASCLNSDDDTLSPEEQKSYQSLMAGTYSGKVRFFCPKTDNYSASTSYQKYDSINAVWTVGTDSTFSISGFPVHMLDSAIVVSKEDAGTEADRYRALGQAISDLEYTESRTALRGFYYIPSKNYVSNTYYQFLTSAATIERTLSFDGTDHKVYFVFAQANGMYVPSSHSFAGQLGLYAICIDQLQLSSQYMVPSRYFRQLVLTFQ